MSGSSRRGQFQLAQKRQYPPPFFSCLLRALNLSINYLAIMPYQKFNPVFLICSMFCLCSK